MIELTLPYPPSVNHYKRIGRLTRTKTGKLYQPRVNTDATKVFYYTSMLKIRSAMVQNRMKTAIPATISLEVCIDLYPPDKRRHDIDNRCKLILDCLQYGGLIENDYQISRLVVQRMSIIEHGQIIVRISPL